MDMGMDMGSDGIFHDQNATLANAYWYLVIATVGLGLLIQVVQAVSLHLR